VRDTQAQEGSASSTTETQIEERAHADNILLSPESVRTISLAIQNRGAHPDTFLAELCNSAVATYPREDGWILLSQDRTVALLKNIEEPARNKEQHHEVRAVQQTPGTPTTPAESVRQTVHTPEHKTEVHEMTPVFIDLLVSGEQQKTFELLRELHAKGVTMETFIMTTVRKLDDVYKNRIEGNHNPDKDLASKTALWSNADFETVLGALVECVDYSYSNNRIGTKIALTKIFEHFTTVRK
jgi:hypothetical protein